jgi:hypothetical protein
VATYGTTIQALTDLPDPPVLCSELVAAAYACAGRWVTPSGGLEDIGETEPYESFDIRDWLGGRFNLTDKSVLNDLERQATIALLDDPFVLSAVVQVKFEARVLTLTGQVEGALGPFQLVLAAGADAVTVDVLLPGQTT